MESDITTPVSKDSTPGESCHTQANPGLVQRRLIEEVFAAGRTLRPHDLPGSRGSGRDGCLYIAGSEQARHSGSGRAAGLVEHEVVCPHVVFSPEDSSSGEVLLVQCWGHYSIFWCLGWAQVVQSLSHIWFFAIPWAAACQASLSFTVSRSVFKLMPTEPVMPSNHLILGHSLLLLPWIFSRIRILSNESALHIRWPKCYSPRPRVNGRLLATGYRSKLAGILFVLFRGQTVLLIVYEINSGSLEGPCLALSWKKESESEVAQSCLTLCDPIDCNLPGSSIHGILQARILEWVAVSFSRGFSWPRDRTWVSFIAGRFFSVRATRPCHWPCLSVPPGEGSSLQWVMSRKAKGPGLLPRGTGLREGQPRVSSAGLQFLLGVCLRTQHPAFSDGLCLTEGVETARPDGWETLSWGQTSKPATPCRERRKDYA